MRFQPGSYWVFVIKLLILWRRRSALSSLSHKSLQALKVVTVKGSFAPFCPAKTTQSHILASTPVSLSSLPGGIQQNIFHRLTWIAHFADLTWNLCNYDELLCLTQKSAAFQPPCRAPLNQRKEQHWLLATVVIILFLLTSPLLLWINK